MEVNMSGKNVFNNIKILILEKNACKNPLASFKWE